MNESLDVIQVLYQSTGLHMMSTSPSLPPAGCGGGALLIPQEVISHSPWRPHPLHTTHLGGGSPGALWGSLVNLSDLG